jgi:hypothetical protein
MGSVVFVGVMEEITGAVICSGQTIKGIVVVLDIGVTIAYWYAAMEGK